MTLSSSSGFVLAVCFSSPYLSLASGKDDGPFVSAQAGWLVLLFPCVEEFYSYNERLFVLPQDLVVKMETRDGLRYDKYKCVWHFSISENHLISLEIILIWLPIFHIFIFLETFARISSNA